MLNDSPKPNQIAAALADEIYRSNDESFRVDVKADALKLSSVEFRNDITPREGTLTTADGYYYNTASGFVGRVLQKGDTYYVVFRGTDNTESAISAVAHGLGFGGSGEGTIDPLDIDTNGRLVFGTYERSQADDALALTKAVLNEAQGRPVVLVGHSLGGGLAGLVKGILGTTAENLSAYLIAPAPFTKHFRAYADMEAMKVTEAQYKDLFAGKEGWSFYEKMQLLQQASRLIEYAQISYSIYDSYLKAATTQSYNHTIKGEALSNDSYWITYIGSFLSDRMVSSSTTQYDVGDGDPATLHSPSLHLLAQWTEDTERPFSALMKKDESLRSVLLGMPGNFENIRPGIAGPASKTRDDPEQIEGVRVTSRMDGSGPDLSELYRALWRSTLENSPSLYDYFHELFDKVMAKGAVGSSAPLLHRGAVELSLGVLRDLVQDAQGRIETLNADDRFAFAGGENNKPYRDRIVIDSLAISDPDETSSSEEKKQVAPDGRPWGMTQIDSEIFNQLYSDLKLYLTNVNVYSLLSAKSPFGNA
jgi:hypothetical protein